MNLVYLLNRNLYRMEYYNNMKQLKITLAELHNQLKIEAETKLVKDTIKWIFSYHKAESGHIVPYNGNGCLHLRNVQSEKDYLVPHYSFSEITILCYYKVIKFIKDNENELMRHNGGISRVFSNAFLIFSSINDFEEQIKINNKLMQDALVKQVTSSKVTTKESCTNTTANHCVDKTTSLLKPSLMVKIDKAQLGVHSKPVIIASWLNDIDDEDETPVQVMTPAPKVNHALLAAERRGEIKRHGLVANAVNTFKKNYYQVKEDARTYQVIRDWQN